MKKLIKLALIVGAITAAARLIGSKKAEWEGLTESQLRDKIDTRMPDRVPEAKRTAVQDKVVDKMRSRGKLAEGETPENDSDE